jgi:hypothetical protein
VVVVVVVLVVVLTVNSVGPSDIVVEATEALESVSDELSGKNEPIMPKTEREARTMNHQRL